MSCCGVSNLDYCRTPDVLAGEMICESRTALNSADWQLVIDSGREVVCVAMRNGFTIGVLTKIKVYCNEEVN